MNALPLTTGRRTGQEPRSAEEVARSVVATAAALHSQPLELAWLREFIRTQLTGGAYPQLVLRLGTVIQTAVSVRRPPAEILFSRGG